MSHNEHLPPVKVHQCLFGYEDGHRLLASSLKLSNDVESMLLKLSDLAPGNIEFNERGYWTGFPLPSIKYYALLHTWPAPEMPRPGCVWTHALLIGFSDIARFADLTVFAKLANRPTLGSYRDKYSQSLSLKATASEGAESAYDPKITSHNFLKIIRAVYLLSAKPYLFAESNELDTSVFRVWSQQWPRLRRSFSFRTTGSLSEKSTAGVHFDFRVLPRSDNYISREEQNPLMELKPWESVAIKDALSPEPTEFRKFLWRYGSDIHKGRENFNFLADLFVSTHKDSSRINSLESTLLRVAKILPDPEEGKALKSDLIESDRNTYSLIPTANPIDILTFFIQHPRIKALPQPAEITVGHLRENWPIRSEEILDLAELAVNKKSKLRDSILSQITELSDADSLIEATNIRSKLRHSLITKKPSLLDSNSLQSIPQPELSTLLTILPDDDKLANKVIRRLVYLDDQHVAREMFQRFPGIVTRIVIEAVEREFSKNKEPVPRNWIRIITESTKGFLSGGYIENIHSMSTLAFFAKQLGYKSREVIEVGPIPWALALSNAKNDISTDQCFIFYAFLLTVAIENPVHGCEPIFERTFEPTYTALANNNLAYGARNLLLESLPYLWWRNWDTCYRLLIAVVRTYINNNLDQESLAQLTNDPLLTNILLDLVNEITAGTGFIGKPHI